MVWDSHFHGNQEEVVKAEARVLKIPAVINVSGTVCLGMLIWEDIESGRFCTFSDPKGEWKKKLNKK